MKKPIVLASGAVLAAVAGIVGLSAFEAHVINVTARIENALYVHPESREFGTVFPQEYRELGAFVTFSQSFSEASQKRVTTVEYDIKQKPKPRPEFLASAGKLPARDWCHQNYPATPYSDSDGAWQEYLKNCYPSLCPYLSKTPDNLPAPGNDTGVLPFHDPEAVAHGKIKKDSVDVGDTWTIDLAVPCFEGMCAQDWDDFVHTHNPLADPSNFVLPPELEHQTFGCDLWIEVTKIY